MSNLKVVGEIKPPDYKDPVQMLRNIAEDIEGGKYGDISTIVVATAGSTGYETFVGGIDSDMAHCAYLFSASALRLHRIPWGSSDL